MVLYTIMPPVEWEATFEAGEEWAAFEEIERDGRRFLVWSEGPLRGRIARVLSTNPDDYLDPRWQPGERL